MGATLTVLTHRRPAPMLQMQKEALRERVNACYGYNAISRIRVTQTGADRLCRDATRRSDPPPRAARRRDPARRPRRQSAAAGVSDPGLRAALAALGSKVLGRRAERKRVPTMTAFPPSPRRRRRSRRRVVPLDRRSRRARQIAGHRPPRAGKRRGGHDAGPAPLRGPGNDAGRSGRPVTVVEYASFTCPHCAQLPRHRVRASSRRDYIDTGKVRFVYREVYFDRYGLWAGMVARCGGRSDTSASST